MFIDSSVIVAILNDEPGAFELEKRLEDFDGTFYCSPLVRFEASVSLARALAEKRRIRRSSKTIQQALELVDDFLAQCEATEMAVDGDIGTRAIQAAMSYGKAVGHPADLNFGDCFSYACAKAHRLGLLYKGEDFSKTDLA